MFWLKCFNSFWPHVNCHQAVLLYFYWWEFYEIYHQILDWSVWCWVSGISDCSGITCIIVVQTIHDKICVWTENPLVNQFWVRAFNILPFDTWSHPCVNFCEVGEKVFRQERFVIKSKPHFFSLCGTTESSCLFWCGFCITVRELRLESGTETNSALVHVDWNAALFAAVSLLALLRETESELLVWARHLQTAIDFRSKMAEIQDFVWELHCK